FPNEIGNLPYTIGPQIYRRLTFSSPPGCYAFLTGKPCLLGLSPAVPACCNQVPRLRTLLLSAFLCSVFSAAAATQKTAEVCPRAEAGSVVASPRDLRSHDGQLIKGAEAVPRSINRSGAVDSYQQAKAQLIAIAMTGLFVSRFDGD